MPLNVPATRLAHVWRAIAKAAAPKNHHRPFLRDVLFEAFPDGFRLIATDGHRIHVAAFGDVPLKSPPTRKAAPPLWRRCVSIVPPVLDGVKEASYEPFEGGKGPLSREGLVEVGASIRYPQWERALPPRGAKGSAETYHPKYLFQAAQLMNTVKVEKTRIVGRGPKHPIEFLALSPQLSAMACVMPIRETEEQKEQWP